MAGERERRGATGTAADGEMPVALATTPEDRIVDLDVRQDLREGREPFRRIMDARKSLPSGGVLRLRAIFEPVPLYRVMAKQGFAHWTERFDDDDWRVWFYPAPERGAQLPDESAGDGDRAAGRARPKGADVAGAADPADAVDGPPDAGGLDATTDDDVVVLDVRGLEPPEPMVRTLEALERLARGETLVQINVRVPRFLLPRLEERGFAYEIREQDGDLVRVFIRHGES